MTSREFYTTIANSEMNEEVRAYAAAAIEKMNAANEKRKTAEKKPSKVALANEEMKPRIVEVIGDQENVTCPVIAEALGVTPQKVAGICVQLANDGILVKGSVKVEGKKRVAYTVAK